MAVKREVAEGVQLQGVDEQIVYTLTTTNWGSSPTSVSMVVKDESSADTDVTSTVTSGSISVSGNVITLKTIKSLTVNHSYRVEVQFTSGSNVFEAFFRIKAEA